ncbi:OprO/OprP family phosphate-selective porin [Bacteroides sp. OttesenSCG-928-E20]|nr:OprO/OprP family phosphate-selective porin [Bacteroides sp. OttesenSCG-928-N06]MDL2299503.1 OprO/OprP family phosphate-selective porin [Bacteroides sp. OttesenSCG-928-E20]MDL2304670.1 OprO/OprP family phosphate-selective porin [Bacteroides sp. OttesenSCG-928-D19]
MKHYRKTRLLLLAFLFCNATLPAQEPNENKLKITPTARFYYDGAAYFTDDTQLSNGTTMPDVRLGLKAKYGKFDIKVDIGYGEKKVKPKDIFMDYHLNSHSHFRVGHVAPPFGLESWETTSSIKFLSENPNSLLFGTDRVLGVTYARYGQRYVVSASVIGDSNAFANDTEGNDGYGLMADGKYVVHQKPQSLLVCGVSSYIRTGNANGYNEDGNENPRILHFASAMNTKVEKRKPISFVVEDVDYQNASVLYMEGRYRQFFLHTEGFFMNIKRKHELPSYRANGFYVQGGVLLFGDESYRFDAVEKKTTRPQRGLELVIRYCHTDMDHNWARINAGKMTDVSFASNYYLNNHVCLRLNYIYQKMGRNCAFLAGENVSSIQGRLQVTF